MEYCTLIVQFIFTKCLTEEEQKSYPLINIESADQQKVFNWFYGWAAQYCIKFHIPTGKFDSIKDQVKKTAAVRSPLCIIGNAKQKSRTSVKSRIGPLLLSTTMQWSPA